MLSKVVIMKNSASNFLDRHGKFLFSLGVTIFLLFIAPHIFAASTGDLKSVDDHVKTEASNDLPDILAWIAFAVGCITAVAKMNAGVVLTMFGIFLLLNLGPGVINHMFTATI